MEKDSSIDETSSLTQSSTKSSNSSRGSSHGKCRSFFMNVEEEDVKSHRCSAECMEKYPIHHAARMGLFEELKTLLEDPQCPKCPLEPDECLQRTPLHYACATGNVEKGLVCVKLLLDCHMLKGHPKAAEKIKGYVNHLDYQRKSALHLAAENEATDIVIELLTNQANFDVSSLDGRCALRDIYKNTPDAMEEALNQSISYTEGCSRPKYDTDNLSHESLCDIGHGNYNFARTCVNVCLDFYPVIGSSMSKQEVECYEEAKATRCSRKQQILAPETRFLYTVNRKRMRAKVRRQILTNALVQAFLYFKWQKIKLFCFFAIFFHIIWLGLYIGTVINVFVLTCPYVPQGQDTEELDQIRENSSDSVFADQTEGPQYCKVNMPTQLAAGILLFLSVTVSIKEFFQFLRLRTIYIRFENMGQCILLTFIFMTVPSIYRSNLTVISPLHFQISAFGIFLSWTLFLCQLAKLPRFRIRLGRKGMIVFPDHGIYVEILSRVFKNFLIFITIFSSLLISFVFSFNILLPTVSKYLRQRSTGFINLTNAIVKVLTMMTGELNYDEIFHTEGSKLVYPVSSHVMYAIFIMVATIILFNLLIGFTVSDIQGLQKDAEINQISNKLEQIFLMECFLLTKVMQKFFRILAKLFFRGNVELLNRIMVVKTTYATTLCYHTQIKVIPFNMRVKIRDHASRNCLAISDISGVARSKIFENRVFKH